MGVASAAPQSTTVYVGKIPAGVADSLVRELLNVCGAVKSWKRVMDPESNTPKRFGFCEFADAEGVLTAMRVLDGFRVSDDELLLNVNQATKAYVESYKSTRRISEAEDAAEDARKRTALAEVLARGTTPTGPAVGPSAAPILAPGMGTRVGTPVGTPAAGAEETVPRPGPEPRGGRDGHPPAAESEADAFLSSIAGGGGGGAGTVTVNVPPPPPPPGANATTKTNHGGDGQPGGGYSGLRAPTFVPARDPASQVPEPAPAAVISPPEVHRKVSSGKVSVSSEQQPRGPRGGAAAAARRERAAREREREEREERARDDRQFKTRERHWEREEEERDRQRRRRREKQRDVERERERWLEDDMRPEPEELEAEEAQPGAATPDILERLVGMGPPEWVRDDRERSRRRRYRVREEEADAQDRENEEKERVRAAEEAAAAAAAADAAAAAPPEVDAMDLEGRPPSPITSAMMAAAGTTASAPGAGTSMNGVGGFKKPKKAAGKKLVKASVFAVEEEEDDAPKRTLIPIDYTEEELAAGARPASTMADDDEESPPAVAVAAAAAVTAKLGAVAKDATQVKASTTKSLIESIPTSKQDIFDYQLDWSVYDSANLGESVQRWVTKKVTELLGEEEPSLVEFVVEKAAEHLSASAMVEELEPVLDTEAEPFVIKLWRMLIYETLKAKEAAGGK